MPHPFIALLLLGAAIGSTTGIRLLEADVSAADAPFKFSGVSWPAGQTVDGSTYWPRAATVDATSGQLYVLADPSVVLRYDPKDGTLLDTWTLDQGADSMAVEDGIMYWVHGETSWDYGNVSLSIQAQNVTSKLLLGSWALDVTLDYFPYIQLVLDAPRKALLLALGLDNAVMLLKYALDEAPAGSALPLLWSVPPSVFGSTQDPVTGAYYAPVLAVDDEGAAYVRMGETIYVVPPEGLPPGTEAGTINLTCVPYSGTNVDSCPWEHILYIYNSGVSPLAAAGGGYLALSRQGIPVAENGAFGHPPTIHFMDVFVASVNGSFVSELPGFAGSEWSPKFSKQYYDLGSTGLVAAAPTEAPSPIFVMDPVAEYWLRYDPTS